LYAAKNTCPQFDNTLADNALILSIDNVNPVYFCSCTTTPKVNLQNLGSNPLTSATFIIELDGQTSTFSWTGNLSRYSKTAVDMPQITLSNNGNHNYKVTVETVNGVADADLVMNTQTVDFNVEVTPSSTTLSEDYSEGIPANQSNPDGLLIAYNTNGTHGGAVCFNAYNFSSGVIAELYMPFEDLSSMSNPTLTFDVAHKRYSTSYTERLRVRYSTDCGNTWQNLYTKSGNSLATATGTATSNFIPTDAQWRTEVVSLANITDRDDVVIMFEFRSGYGNNVWIDNVNIGNGTGLSEVESNLSIYPNPATDVINISTDSQVERVEIFNMQGQLVKVETGDMNSISVKDLANGMYTMKLTTENGTSVHKIMKK
jgi:hypothetical protein